MNKRVYAHNVATINKDEYEKILEKLGLNREGLASALGVSHPTVRSWYTKGKQMPLYAQKFLEVALELEKYKSLYVDIKSLYKNIDTVKKSLKELEP